jgi:hypothetical protein
VSAPAPPQNVDAEESLLSALMLAGAQGPKASTKAIAAVKTTDLQAADFSRPSHARIFEAVLALDARGAPAVVLAVEAELRATRKLKAAGGKERLQELATIVPATMNAPFFAAAVVEASERRREVEVALALKAAAETDGGLAADTELRERVAGLLVPRRGGQAQRQLAGLSHADLLRVTVPPTQELVQHLMEAGTVGTFAALPETFKSWLAQELAHKVAGGGLVLGRLKVLRQGPVGYWWQDDSTENEVRRIQAYAGRHRHGAALPIRWHLNEGLRLPGDLGALRAEVEREQQVLVVLDSLYNFLPGAVLKEEEVAAVFTAMKEQVCDPTGATVAVVDHAPWPTDANRTQRRAYGSVFKAAAIRWGIYLMREGDTMYVEARGNNLTGLSRTAAVWDAEQLELRLVAPPAKAVELADRIDDFLRRNPGATTTAVRAGVEGKDTAIDGVLERDRRFVTVPPIVFAKPRNSTCWARAEDAPSLLDQAASTGGEQ